MAEHGFPDYHSNLLIDKVRTKYSWAKGSSRGSDEAVSQHSRDLAVAFAEIDGLMAGFKYTDKLQQLSIDDDDADMSSPCASADSSSPPSYPIRLDIPLGDALDDPPRPEESLGQDNTATTPSNLPPAADTVGGPMARQWDAILELRKEINQHHKRFLVQTQGTDDAIIQSLRTEFPCANKIRETGPLLMRGILEGDQPESIADIFAFTSLSYAVSKILIRRNRMKQSDILADLDVWRDAISDPAERMSFDIISQKLWPEAQGGGWYADGAGPAAPPHVDQDVPYPRDLSTYVIRQFVQTHQACDYEWAAHNLPAWGVDHYENMTPGRALSNSGPVQFEYTHEPQLPGPSAAAPQEPLHGPGLQRSMTFLVVFTYLLEIEQLVLTLSGQTLVPSPHKPSKLFLRDRFLTELKALFVESPLGASKKSDFRFRAFLSVALFLASLGYFKSISEVKHYMITVGGSVSTGSQSRLMRGLP